MGADRSGAVVVQQDKPEKITGFIDALSQIEGYRVMESKSGGIPGDLYTTKLAIEYGMVGLKSVLASTLLLLLLTPLCVGVWVNVLPVYGSSEPGLTDKVLALVLTVSFSLGYAILSFKLGNLYEGEFTKKMIRDLVIGIGAGALLKIFVALAFFNYLALVILDPVHWENLLLKMQGFLGWNVINWLYVKGLLFRNVFLLSALLMTVISVLHFLVPIIAIQLKKKRDNNLESLGGKRI